MKARKLLRTFFALPDRNRRAALITIAAVAFAVRIGFALTMRPEFYFPDSRRYSEAFGSITPDEYTLAERKRCWKKDVSSINRP